MIELYKETILSMIITELAAFEDVTEKEFFLKYEKLFEKYTDITEGNAGKETAFRKLGNHRKGKKAGVRQYGFIREAGKYESAMQHFFKFKFGWHLSGEKNVLCSGKVIYGKHHSASGKQSKGLPLLWHC